MLVADSDSILKASAGHGPAMSESGKNPTPADTVGRRHVSSTKNGVSDFMARARLVEDRLRELGALYQMARFAGRTFFEEFCRYPSSLSYPPLAVTPRCIAGMMRLIGGHRDSRSVVECVGQALARHRFRVPEGAQRPERTLSALESGVAGAGLRRAPLPPHSGTLPRGSCPPGSHGAAGT